MIDLKKITEEVASNRAEVIDRLARYAATDLLFFWGQEKDLMIKQQELWKPILDWATDKLETKFEVSYDLVTHKSAKESETRMEMFLNSLSDKELAGFYVAGLNTKSLLVAAALVKRQINAETAIKAAFLEEDFQASNWGSDDEYIKRREEITNELKAVEEFLK